MREGYRGRVCDSISGRVWSDYSGLNDLLGETMAEKYPSFDLSGQIALVTAAARGLGRASALALAHAGADVALGLRRKESGAALVKEIEAMGRRALPLQ